MKNTSLTKVAPPSEIDLYLLGAKEREVNTHRHPKEKKRYVHSRITMEENQFLGK